MRVGVVAVVWAGLWASRGPRTLGGSSMPELQAPHDQHYCSGPATTVWCLYRNTTQVVSLSGVLDPRVQTVVISNARKLRLSQDVCVNVQVHNVSQVVVEAAGSGHNCSSKKELLATYSTLAHLPRQVDWVQLVNCTMDYLVAAAALRHLKVINSQVTVVEVALAPDTTAELRYSQLQQVQQLLVPGNSSLLLNNIKLSTTAPLSTETAKQTEQRGAAYTSGTHNVIMHVGASLLVQDVYGHLDVRAIGAGNVGLQKHNLSSANASPVCKEGVNIVILATVLVFLLISLTINIVQFIYARKTVGNLVTGLQSVKLGGGGQREPEVREPLLDGAVKDDLQAIKENLRSVSSYFSEQLQKARAEYVSTKVKQEKIYSEERKKKQKEMIQQLSEIEKSKNQKLPENDDLDKKLVIDQHPNLISDAKAAEEDLINAEYERDVLDAQYHSEFDQLQLQERISQEKENYTKQVRNLCEKTLMYWNSTQTEEEFPFSSSQQLVCLLVDAFHARLTAACEAYDQLIANKTIIRDQELTKQQQEYTKECGNLKEELDKEMQALEQVKAEELDTWSGLQEDGRWLNCEIFRVKEKCLSIRQSLRLRRLGVQYSGVDIRLKHLTDVDQAQEEQLLELLEVARLLQVARAAHVELLDEFDKILSYDNR